MEKVKTNKQILIVVLIILFTISIYHIIHYTICNREPFQQISMSPKTDYIRVQTGNTIPLATIAESNALNNMHNNLDIQIQQLQTILDDINQFQLNASAKYSNIAGDPYEITIDGEVGNQTVHYMVPIGGQGPKGSKGAIGITGQKGITGPMGKTGNRGYFIS